MADDAVNWLQQQLSEVAEQAKSWPAWKLREVERIIEERRLADTSTWNPSEFYRRKDWK